jgi:ABC-type sugar transport system ATPase subunit
MKRVTKSFGDVDVIKGVDLEIADGEFCVLVGPSGCGKSTLLRMIAGLEDVSGGELSIGGRVVNDIAPSERGVSMVFQSYALYPHMSVYQNMAFGLKLAKTANDTIDRRVRDVAASLQLTPLLDRKPKELSGGQRQRVAIGRAIVRDPKVFLFDEPLSNLDAALRVQMRLEISELHRRIGTTMIHVTHDQVEAMTLADKIIVLNQGRVEQVGSPRDLYDRPANTFVAGFIGSPAMNLLEGRIEGGVLALTDHGVRHRLHAEKGDAEFDFDGSVIAGIRPEHFVPADAADGWPLAVSVIEDLGDTMVLHGALGAQEPKGEGPRIAVRIDGDSARPEEGKTMWVRPAPGRVHLFDAQDRKRLTPQS